MAQRSKVSPHRQDLSSDYSTLDGLCVRALRRYGNFAPYSGDDDVLMMFIEMANEVIEDIRSHPYWQGGDIDYYTAITESRPVPDQIIQDGILYKFAEQQMSEKMQIYGQKYYNRMSQILWERLNGNAPINLHVVDQPTNFTPALRSMLETGS